MEAKTASSFELLGKRWSAMIVQDLVEGPQRFRELLHHLVKINDKVLSQRLKELEGAQILRRQVFAEVPIRVEYSLSPKGHDLSGIIREMETWDTQWANGQARKASGNGNGANVAKAKAMEEPKATVAPVPVTTPTPATASTTAAPMPAASAAPVLRPVEATRPMPPMPARPAAPPPSLRPLSQEPLAPVREKKRKGFLKRLGL